MPYTKEEKREYDREYRQKNKEKIAEYDRLRYQKNKEKASEYKKEWYQKNKERDKEKRAEYNRLRYQEKKENINQICREYREKNKEKIAEQNKAYKKTPEGTKGRRLSDWKNRGLIHDDLDELYERYLQATHCDECEEEFIHDKGAKQRCMDHCHISGLFRNFLCKSCNIKRK